MRTHCAYANFDRVLDCSCSAGAGVRAHINVYVHGLVYTHAVNVHMYVCAQLHNLFFYGALPQTEKNWWNKCKNHLNEMKGDVGMSFHEKEANKKNLHQADNPSLHLCS